MNKKTESFSLHPHPVQLTDDKNTLWKKCDVNKLVEHFHRYDKDKDDGRGQVDRLGVLHLDAEKRARLFPEKKHAAGKKLTITSFHISFGLDEEKSPTDRFTFRPAIHVVFSDGCKEDAEFDYGLPKEDGSQITNEVHNNVVPPPFKEWLSKNWMELDINLVDDVFVAFPKPDVSKTEKTLVPPRRESVRLRGYHFTSTTNNEFLKFINDCLERPMLQFYFHLGIDMNKFGHKEEFSFSPVFEVVIPEPPPRIVVDIHRYGLRSVQIKGEDEQGKDIKILGESVFYEYMMPCPSSCPQE